MMFFQRALLLTLVISPVSPFFFRGFRVPSNSIAELDLTNFIHHDVYPSKRLFKLFNNIKSSSDMTYNEDEYLHLKNEFNMLSSGEQLLDFTKFLKWEEVRALLEDDTVSLSEMKQIWRKHSESVQTKIDFSTFVKINEDLDDLFEDDDDELTDIDDEEISDDNDEDEGKIIEFEEFDVWDPSVKAQDLFDVEFIKYLQGFYDKKKSKKTNLLGFKSFYEWTDVREMLEEGNIDVLCLRELWAEALSYKQNYFEDDKIIEFSDFITKPATVENSINFDIFIKMNYRLEEMVEDIKKALENLSEEDIEQYYRKEFHFLTGGKRLLNFYSLINWSLIQEMFENNEIKFAQLLSMWEALPKELITDQDIDKIWTDYKNIEIKNEIPLFKGFDNNQLRKQQIDEEEKEKFLWGITVEGFIMLNNAIEDSLSDIDLGEMD